MPRRKHILISKMEEIGMKEEYKTPRVWVISTVHEDVITISNETPFVPFNMTETGRLSTIE